MHIIFSDEAEQKAYENHIASEWPICDFLITPVSCAIEIGFMIPATQEKHPSKSSVSLENNTWFVKVRTVKAHLEKRD